MHSTTPSGERRICPKTPCSMTKRDDCRSRSLTACTVSRTYSTVRSHSFSASPCGFPISHMRSFTTSARSGFSFARNVSTAFRRSAMVARGHAPRPRSYARFGDARPRPGPAERRHAPEHWARTAVAVTHAHRGLDGHTLASPRAHLAVAQPAVLVRGRVDAQLGRELGGGRKAEGVGRVG